MVGFLNLIKRAVKTPYRRITLTRYTTLFFISSIILCLSQGVIQSFLFGTDLSAEQMVARILSEAQVPMTKLAYHTRQNGQEVVKLCSAIPGTVPNDPCVTVYDGTTTPTSANWSAPPGYRRDNDSDASRPLHTVMMPVLDDSGTVILSEQCTRVMLYPDVVLKNSKREEIVLLASHFWLFGISFYALLFDSSPHIFAVLCMRVLEAGWSAYTIWRTMDIHLRFMHLISDDDSPCHANLLPTYLTTRLALQIMDLVLNLAALICITLLSWRLVKAFNAQTFKRIGPPEHILRMHRPYYAISVCLYVSIFLTVTVLSLWSDQLMNTAISVISQHTTLYKTLYFFTIATVVPWTYLGLQAVRRENRWFMSIFLALCLFYVTGWSLMFKAKEYQWTWLQWPFFACMTIASLMTLILAGVCGILCWLNFGKGLASYLEAEAQLAKSNFEPSVFSTESLDPPEIGHSRGRSITANGVFITMRHDSNWNFDEADKDSKRPPIYVVELESDLDHDVKYSY